MILHDDHGTLGLESKIVLQKRLENIDEEKLEAAKSILMRDEQGETALESTKEDDASVDEQILAFFNQLVQSLWSYLLYTSKENVEVDIELVRAGVSLC